MTSAVPCSRLGKARTSLPLQMNKREYRRSTSFAMFAATMARRRSSQSYLCRHGRNNRCFRLIQRARDQPKDQHIDSGRPMCRLSMGNTRNSRGSWIRRSAAKVRLDGKCCIGGHLWPVGEDHCWICRRSVARLHDIARASTDSSKATVETLPRSRHERYQCYAFRRPRVCAFTEHVNERCGLIRCYPRHHVLGADVDCRSEGSGEPERAGHCIDSLVVQLNVDVLVIVKPTAPGFLGCANVSNVLVGNNAKP